MSNKEILEKVQKSCPVDLVKGDDKAWNLVIGHGSPDCMEVLQEIMEKAGPETRKHLATRVKTDDPNLRKILDSSDK